MYLYSKFRFGVSNHKLLVLHIISFEMMTPKYYCI